MKKSTLLLALAFLLLPFVAFAQEVVEAASDTVCIQGLDTISAIIATIVGGIVTAASVLANYVGKDTVIGKIVNFLAINIKVQKKGNKK